jgi:hypothetical protein
MTVAVEEMSRAMREAVRDRLAATPADDPKMIGYKLDQGDPEPTCCEGQRTVVSASWDNAEMARADCERQLRGDSLLRDDVHPVSQKYFDLLETLRRLHLSKSAGYGCPDGTDPLLNIRRGAEFVGIPAWQGAMVRLSDKVTRLAVFNKTGNLPHESVEDTLLDLASYSLLALLLYQEEQK